MLHNPSAFSGPAAFTRIGRPDRPHRVCFFLQAQIHQAMHTLPIAVELSREPGVEVHILAASREHLDLARRLAFPARAGKMTMGLIGGGLDLWKAMGGKSIPPKLLSLASAARQLNRFDAVVVPERTTLLLRHFGVRRPAMIHTAHGAGDREVGYDRRIRQFDFALVAGEKQRRRMLEAGLIRPEAHAVVGYPKFDAVEWLRPAQPRLFAEERPTILYNPHCNRRLTSWHRFGTEVIARFAADPRYNLIVAPHIKLFDDRRQRAAAEKMLSPFARCPNIHIDLGSARSCDMTYSAMADIYLGDVSSQIYEFLASPRPCLFLDGHGADWRDDPNYRHWHFGAVLGGTDHLLEAVDNARRHHRAYLDAQWEGLGDTMDMGDVPAARRAAHAIRSFLDERVAHGQG